ncbi:MAG: Transposase [Candidatus Accumulibacter adjunctus]|uniref:Transposase n=1 Tax=Candidatus Accumulibacter adjunctus TaxID=1454001 RepID=A0A011NTX8_9PROT|nr:MAG: Transposase [Candidatus Accumulibacter adjunctus]
MDTAFRWRHRFLQCIKAQQPQTLAGLVEADETFFRESFKGERGGALYRCRRPKTRGTPAAKRGLSREQIPVLVARDRASGSTLSAVIAGRTATAIGRPLIGHLAEDAELFTDGASAYCTLAKKHGIELRIAPRSVKHKTKGALHITTSTPTTGG